MIWLMLTAFDVSARYFRVKHSPSATLVFFSSFLQLSRRTENETQSERKMCSSEINYFATAATISKNAKRKKGKQQQQQQRFATKRIKINKQRGRLANEKRVK